MRRHVEAKSKHDNWYQSETMRGLGTKRGKMDLTQTKVVVDKPKRKYNFFFKKEMKVRKVEMLKFKKLGAMFVHFWMTRSVVEKNKGLPILNLHFGVEFLKIFQKYHSCHPCFGVCLLDDSTR